MMKIQKNLLYTAIITTPFFMSLNITFLGGLGSQASFYPLFLGVLIFLLEVLSITE